MKNDANSSTFSACDQKAIIVHTPDIKVHSESQALKVSPDIRKKSIIDSGIELFFKKNPKISKDGCTNENIKNRTETASLAGEKTPDERKDKWKPFESIKIYTEKRKSNESGHTNHDSKLKK